MPVGLTTRQTHPYCTGMMQPTNEEVAKRLGVTHSLVSRLRGGKRKLSLPVIYGLRDEYGIDPAELVSASETEAATGVCIRHRVFGGQAPCECGCWALPKGKASRFVPGHDARVHVSRRP